MRVEKEMQMQMLKQMIEIRMFEEHVSHLRYDGIIYGSVHCCVGQEAISTGVCMALEKEDLVMGNHRSHGFVLAKGVPVKNILAEIYGKKEGTNGGRGGSMHVCDASYGLLGATGIVGSGLPVACGSAFASKYKNDGKITVCFLGDGASNEGTFHECLNLASVWKLPILIVLENNGLAVTTTIDRTTANLKLYQRAKSYNMLGMRIDGQDVEKVFCAVKNARRHILEGAGPILIEATTYRFHEHAEGKGYLRMKGTGYRSEAEIDEAKKINDPIEILKNKMIGRNFLTQKQFAEISEDTYSKIIKIDKYVRQCDEPDALSAKKFLYAEEQNG